MQLLWGPNPLRILSETLFQQQFLLRRLCTSRRRALWAKTKRTPLGG
jgi:hypothetical protein